jgi:phosphohistidine phosphatase
MVTLSPMRVILIRHGNASMSSPLGDNGRWLTIAGREQARETGRALARHAIRPTQVWTSPLVRAVQTAELVVAGIEYAGEIESRDDLYSESDLDGLIDAIGKLGDRETVCVIGHQPFMSKIASALLGYSVSGFTTGAAYCLRIEGAKAELEWRWPA